jgi:hypothetical protein
MTILAGMVTVAGLVTRLTVVNVAAERLGATLFDVSHRL